MSKIYKIFTILSIITLIFGAVGLNSVAYAAGQETCPADGDWVKVGVDAQSVTYTAPDGYEISQWCYKAGTTLVTGTKNPPVKSITLTSNVPNPTGNAFLDISHASFLLVPVEDNTCEQTTESAGEWSDWVVDTNDPTREVRERTITLYDSEDPSVVCSSYPEYEYRPIEDNTCEQTTESAGEWSDWVVDTNDPTREVRERTITLYDSEDPSVVCGSYPEYEYRPVDPEEVSVYVDPQGICRWTGSQSEWTYHAIISGGEDGWVTINVVNPSLSFSTVGTHEIVVIGPGNFSWSTVLNNPDAILTGDVEGTREFGTCEPKIDPTPTPPPTPPPNTPPAGAGTPQDFASIFRAMMVMGSGGTALSLAGYINSKKKEKIT